jgi:hypothetical protein
VTDEGHARLVQVTTGDKVLVGKLQRKSNNGYQDVGYMEEQ